MTQQFMILFKNHDYIVSQPIDYRSYTSITLKQNSINMVTQDRTKEICSVNNNK
jgi:hypothetical protein